MNQAGPPIRGPCRFRWGKYATQGCGRKLGPRSGVRDKASKGGGARMSGRERWVLGRGATRKTNAAWQRLAAVTECVMACTQE